VPVRCLSFPDPPADRGTVAIAVFARTAC